jgi:hypothetical protein
MSEQKVYLVFETKKIPHRGGHLLKHVQRGTCANEETAKMLKERIERAWKGSIDYFDAPDIWIRPDKVLDFTEE